VLIHSWPTVIDRAIVIDIAINVLMYMPVGIFSFLALRQNFRAATAVTMTLIFALALSSSIEMTQLFDDGRICSASDLACNFGGAVIGVALGARYQHWLRRFLARPETSAFLHTSAAVLLFYMWLAYQAFPLIPELHRTMLAAKFHDLVAHLSVSPLLTFTSFVELLVVAQLVEGALGAESTRRLFPLLLLVLPAKLLIVRRSLTCSELDGAVLASLCSYFLGGNPRRTRLVSSLIVS
jgi:VanZ family protein